MAGEKTPKKKGKAATTAMPATEAKKRSKLEGSMDDGRPATVGKKPKPTSQPVTKPPTGAQGNPNRTKKFQPKTQPGVAGEGVAGRAGGAPSTQPAQQTAHPAGARAPGQVGDHNMKAGSGNKSGKRKRQKVDESALLPEERERRRRQRELRELALKLRAKGQNYNPKRAKRQGQQEKDRGHKPRRAVQVIIVPIYWNKKPDEKDVVLGAAQRAQQLLRDAGVKCDTDTTNEKTPGQKYRYWEERGVGLRVELGPKEAQTGRCVLAKCKNPGEVAQKSQLEVGHPLVVAVCDALSMACPAGVAAAPPTSDIAATAQPQQNGSKKARKDQGQEPAPLVSKVGSKAQQAKHAAAGSAAPPQQVAPQPFKGPAAAPATVQQPAPGMGSGDALEDDFGALVEQQEKAAAQRGKKGKKGKQRGDGSGLAADGDDQEGMRVLLGGEGEGLGGKKSKGPKLVKF